MRKPWMKFYPSDWRADPALRMCSIGARGLWMEMICVMHEAEPYGSLLVNGMPVSEHQLAGLAGINARDARGFLNELRSSGVFSANDGTIISRRMQRDHDKAERDKANGKGGGNPDLKPTVNEGVNPPDNGVDKAQRLEARDQNSEKKKNNQAVAIAAAAEFEKFWAAYPRREGSNPKKPAAEKFLRLVLSGINPADIIAGAKRYAEECARLRTEPKYVAQAVTWINQQRFSDYSATAQSETAKIIRPRHGQVLGPEFGEKAVGRFFVLAETPEWDEWCRYLRGLGKPAPPRYFHEGWVFMSLWPPGYEPQSEAAE